MPSAPLMPSDHQQRRLELIIPLLVATIMFMEFLDITIINTAVPSIAASFAISPIILKFSVASYYVSLAIFIPISGWCTDKFGTRKMFLFSVGLFTLASLLCGKAHNVPELTLFRFLQGIGGAFMNPVARIIVLRLFGPKDIVRVQGIIFTPAMLGFAIGPFLGGFITDYFSWGWIFYVNLPIGIAALAVGWRYVKEYATPNLPLFDVTGFIMAGTSLLLITFFMEFLNHYELVSRGWVYTAGLVGSALFLALIAYCWQQPRPILDFRLLKIKTFQIGFAVNLGMYAFNAGTAFLLPLMFQESFHLTPLQSGLLTLPIAVGYVTLRSLAPKLINNMGFRQSMVVFTITTLLFFIGVSLITHSSPTWYIWLVEVGMGASTVIVGSSTGALNYVDVAKDAVSQATAIDLTFRQFASGVGIGITSFALTYFSSSWHLRLTDLNGLIFRYTFWLLGGLVILSLLCALRLERDAGAHALRRKLS